MRRFFRNMCSSSGGIGCGKTSLIPCSVLFRENSPRPFCRIFHVLIPCFKPCRYFGIQTRYVTYIRRLLYEFNVFCHKHSALFNYWCPGCSFRMFRPRIFKATKKRCMKTSYISKNSVSPQCERLFLIFFKTFTAINRSVILW